jgi:hypothetical protein
VVTADIGLLIGGYFVVSVILLISCVTVIGPFILAGPLFFGYFRVADKRLRGEAAVFDELFSGFQEFGRSFLVGLLWVLVWVAAMVAVGVVSVVLHLLPCIGTVLSALLGLVVGVFVTAMTLFVFPIAALTNTEPMEAVTRSIKFCFDQLAPTVMLALLLFGLVLVGAVCCGVGVLVTVPMAMVIQVIAYREFYLPKAGV